MNETKILERVKLKERTKKYLPEIKFEVVENSTKKEMLCNFQNSFI